MDHQSLTDEVRKNLEAAKINLLLSGFPKCGTTSFAAWLDESPSVTVCNPKETFLLCREHRRTGKIASEGNLAKCFTSSDAPIRVEASTLNVYSSVLFDEVKASTSMKTILAFRDPVESVLSWHNQVVQAGEAICDDFQSCWDRSVEEQTNPGQNPTPLSLMQNYASVCSYGHWIEQWLEAVGDERLLIVEADELRVGGDSLRRRLDCFLGTSLQLSDKPPVLNSYASIRCEPLYRGLKTSVVNRSLRDLERRFPALSGFRRTVKEKLFRKKAKKCFDESLLAQLHEYFASDISKCKTLYAKNVQYWDNAAIPPV